MLLRPVRALVAPCVFLPTAGCRLWFRTAFFWRAPTNRMGNREAKKSPIVEGKRILARPLARKKKRAWGALSFHKKDEKGACWFAFDRYKGSSQCVQMGKKEQHTTIWIPAVRKKGGVTWRGTAPSGYAVLLWGVGLFLTSLASSGLWFALLFFRLYGGFAWI